MSLPYTCNMKVVSRIQPGCALGIKMIETCVLPLEKQFWRPVMRKYHSFIRAWYHPIGTASQIAHMSNQRTSFLIQESGIHRPNDASWVSSEFYPVSTYQHPTIQRYTGALHRWKEFSKIIDPAHRDVFNKSSLIFIFRYHGCTPLNCPTQDYLRRSNVQASWDGLYVLVIHELLFADWRIGH